MKIEECELWSSMAALTVLFTQSWHVLGKKGNERKVEKLNSTNICSTSFQPNKPAKRVAFAHGWWRFQEKKYS